jgi:NADH dehydrogenase
MIIVTGANGHLGARLLEALRADGHELRAVVRSANAAAALRKNQGVEALVVDYGDRTALAPVLAGADAVVHLVGIIRETPQNRYEDAHERTCRALVAALAANRSSPRIVYVSILGSSAIQENSCLRSKGKAEDLLLESGLPVTILQVPMVLGESDYATFALRKKALAGTSIGFRMTSLEQPIYAGDVVNAIRAALGESFGRLLLAGPESLSRADLVRRAGVVLGSEPRPLSLPIGLGRAVIGLLEAILPNPPMTRAMLDVLDHDDQIDPLDAARRLGISLTSLDQTLRSVLQPLK